MLSELRMQFKNVQHLSLRFSSVNDCSTPFQMQICCSYQRHKYKYNYYVSAVRLSFPYSSSTSFSSSNPLKSI